MRVWLVTALDREDKFIDQRRIEAGGQNQAENWAYEWIRRVGGQFDKSKIEEIR
jgi:hypothetical protein